MPSERDRRWLEDISENIRFIGEFTAGMDQAGFEADVRTRYAVLHGLAVISEASRRLPVEIKDRHPHIPWRDMADAGNIYRHQYHDLNTAIVWKTLSESLNPLKKAVDGELR